MSGVKTKNMYQRCMHYYPKRIKGPDRTKGSVLVLALVFLLLTTVIASSTFFGSFTETRKAGNFTAETLTFESAEAALRDAEAQLIQTNPRPNPAVSSIDGISTNPSNLPIYLPAVLQAVGPDSATPWQGASTNWWETYGQSLPSISADTQDPIVIVEEIDFSPDSATLKTVYGQSRPGVIFYEINSRNQGNRASTTTLQSTLGARYN